MTRIWVVATFALALILVGIRLRWSAHRSNGDEVGAKGGANLLWSPPHPTSPSRLGYYFVPEILRPHLDIPILDADRSALPREYSTLNQILESDIPIEALALRRSLQSTMEIRLREILDEYDIALPWLSQSHATACLEFALPRTQRWLLREFALRPGLRLESAIEALEITNFGVGALIDYLRAMDRLRESDLSTALDTANYEAE